MAWGLLSSPLLAYFFVMLLGLEAGKGLKQVLLHLPSIFLAFGVLYPLGLFRVLVGRAMSQRPEDVPGARLERLLRLPWRASYLSSCVTWPLGGLCFSRAVGAQGFGWGVLSLLMGFCCGVVLAFPVAISLEHWLRPLALEEQRRHPTVVPSGGGLTWPRQSWFQPLAYAASVLCVLLLSGSLVVAQMVRLNGAERALQFLSQHGLLLVWIAGFALVIPTLTAWMMARRLAAGARTVRTAIESLAAGRVCSPEWISTDELGDLAAGMNAVLARLRQFPLSLQSSALRLQEAGHHLHQAHLEHEWNLSRQAEALMGTQVTAEELKQTSRVAADRAMEVLQVARRAEELGQQGETAIEQSMMGLASLHEFVLAIQDRLNRLQESAREIGHISRTVKELAEQSNVLALNAAIEAVRSGEHGKGFNVVAREMRALAHQSASATVRIRPLLDEVTRAIHDAAALGDKGTRQASSGLARMRASADTVRELTHILQASATSVRQIATVVTQQSLGFSHLSQAIYNLSRHTEDTMARLESTKGAARTLNSVSGEVDQLAHQLGTG
jgi:methyl-accepting chemotaxis protein